MIVCSGKIYVTVMKRMGAWGSKGFALPTVMIASVVMLMVLLSGLVAASSANSAIRDQYQQKVVRLASEAGVAMVNACLAQSYNAVTWTGKVLRPNTDCNGDPITGSAYVMDTPTLKTTFEVPELTVENGTQRANVTARVLSYRASGLGTPQESTLTNSALIGAQTGFSNVTFGYCASCGAGDGAQIAVVLATGEVKTLGQNDNGRLGTGSTGNITTPQTFILPINERGIASFSNFLSIGRQISVLTASGKVYSAGSNEYGQLGNPSASTTGPISTPVQYGSLGNSSQPRGTYVGMSNYATYVMASDNNMYSAGSCVSGLLGTGCGSGTSATPVRVALPTPTSDLNTQPQNVSSSQVAADNLVVDRLNAYVRMKGGAVYGWGINDFGQLGTGNTTQSNTPVRLRALGSSGSPFLNATQLAFNGTAVYALDTTGQVWAAGSNEQGEQLGSGSNLQNIATATCMRPSSNTAGSTITLVSCNSTDGWQYIELWPDRTLRFRTDSTTYGPTDSMLCITQSTSAGGTATLQSCSPDTNARQRYTVTPDGTTQTGKIIADSMGCLLRVGTNVVAGGSSCGDANSSWQTRLNTYFRPVPRPPYDPVLGRHPRYVRVTTDNRAVLLLDENGAVWAAGSNNRGQLGTSSSRGLFAPMLKRVVLPTGSRVVDLYVTEADPVTLADGINYASYNNSYFVLEDGSVYGAGANNHGQLGNSVALPGPNAVITPVRMNLPTGVLARSAQSGFGTAVILSTTGKVFTVGNNSNGQLGDGTTASKSVPAANTYTNQRTTIIY